MSVETYISEICRLVIVFILLAAAWGKTNTFESFRLNLTESFKVPKVLSKSVTVVIVSTEWILAVAILTNSSLTQFAMFAALFLFVSFTLMITSVLVQDKIVSCNCFGRTDRKISFYDLTRNILLLSAVSYFLTFQPGEQLVNMKTQILLASISFILFQVFINLFEIVTLVIHPWKE